MRGRVVEIKNQREKQKAIVCGEERQKRTDERQRENRSKYKPLSTHPALKTFEKGFQKYD